MKLPAADPQTIGRETRRLVQVWLRDHPGFSLDPRFLERLEKLAGAICVWGSRMNLTAEPSDSAQLAFHIVDSLMPLVLVQATPGSSPDTEAARAVGVNLARSDLTATIREGFGEQGRVLDLGAGAGFPGLVLAAATPASFVLLESRRKRASFLTVTAADMSLPNVTVESVRGVSRGMEASIDLVVARAFGRPSEVHRAAAKALRLGGVAMLYASPDQALDLDVARESGMGEHMELPYTLTREATGASRVERTLAVWRKL